MIFSCYLLENQSGENIQLGVMCGNLKRCNFVLGPFGIINLIVCLFTID